MNLGDKIKALRLKNKITQQQLAERLYVTRTAISKWERNAGYPNLDSLKLIAKEFSISLDELLSNEDINLSSAIEIKTSGNKIATYFFAAIDILFILFLFLPLFGQKLGDRVAHINIFGFLDLPLFLEISYYGVIGIIVALGVSQFALGILKNKNVGTIFKLLSIAAGALALLIFIGSQQPYAATLAFVLLSIKTVFTVKFKSKK